jgi:methoxymalonate biosynthesis acyl carrier protein
LGIIENVRKFLMINLLALDDDLTIEDDENIFESGFVDSSFAMQLISFVEEAFNITVTDEDLDLANFSTISRIVQFVEKKRNG